MRRNTYTLIFKMIYLHLYICINNIILQYARARSFSLSSFFLSITFYISNVLSTNILQQSESNYYRNPEYLITEIFISSSKSFLVVVY